MVSYVAKPDEEFLTFYIERKKVAGKAASAVPWTFAFSIYIKNCKF